MKVPVAPSVARSFPQRRAGHCASGALRDLLEHHRLAYGTGPLSEPMAFGLSGGYVRKSADALRDQTVVEAATTATVLSEQWKASAASAAAHDLDAARESVDRIDHLEHEALPALEALL